MDHQPWFSLPASPHLSSIPQSGSLGLPPRINQPSPHPAVSHYLQKNLTPLAASGGQQKEQLYLSDHLSKYKLKRVTPCPKSASGPRSRTTGVPPSQPPVWGHPHPSGIYCVGFALNELPCTVLKLLQILLGHGQRLPFPRPALPSAFIIGSFFRVQILKRMCTCTHLSSFNSRTSCMQHFNMQVTWLGNLVKQRF